MAILDWTYSPADAFEREFDRLRRQMGGVFSDFGISQGFGSAFPGMNVYDEGDDLFVAVEAPGVSKDNLKVEVRENILTVQGTRKPASYPEAAELRQECACGDFRRTLRIPFKVEQDKIEASYKDGMLLIKMPKSEEAKPKHIAIHA